MTTILVTGASGFVGSHLVPELIGDGHRVVALVRGPRAGATVLRRLAMAQRGSVELRIGDVTDPGSLPAAMAGVDAVVHLVAIARDRDGGRSLRRVNTDGTANIVTAAREAGVRRLVHQGALGVADDPRLHYASSKARAEALVAGSDLDWTITKPSLLWGERDGFFNIIADLVRLSPGLVPVPGRGDSRFQPLWVRDLAHGMAGLFHRPDSIGRTYELGGPRVWTYRQLTEEVLRGMGARRLIVPMPVPVIRFVARASERLGIPFPVATDQIRQLGLDNVGPEDGFIQAFGFAPTDMAGRLDYLRRRRTAQEPAAASTTSAGMPA